MTLPDQANTAAEIESIFFAASDVRVFSSDEARAAFRERWLGRYLEHDPAHVYVALSEGRVAGYLAGCLDDPATAERFSDIPYFRAFASVTRDFPAHLHVNLAEPWRGIGVGGALVEAFARDAAETGAPGVHVVTGKGRRNAGFYSRHGFETRAVTEWNGKEVVLLGRVLTPGSARL